MISSPDTSQAIDSALGALLGTVMSMFILLGMLFPTYEALKYSQFGYGLLFFSLGAIAALILNGWFVYSTWSSILRNRHPLALAVSLSQPKWFFLFRPFVSLWWFFHLILASGWTVALSIMLTYELEDPPLWSYAAVAVAGWGFAYLSYGFLLLALTNFSKRQELVLRAWGFRKYWAWILSILAVVPGLADLF